MTIGPVQTKHPLSQAGLAGYSDRAMRLVARRRGCPYAVTEALLDIIMLNGGEGLRRSIDISDEDHPIAGQLMGSDPEQMARAARLLADAGYDVIDLNFACPVKKIRTKARGGHLMGEPETAIQIIKTVRESLPPTVPMTVKLRRGYDDSPEAADAFDTIIQTAHDVGYAGACVHGRTVAQKYDGYSNWDFLRDLKRRYPTWTIIGSGDILTAHDAVRMLRQTGVDAVSVARGAIGNPWIFQQAADLLAGLDPQELRPPTVHVQREALQEHFLLAMEIHGEQLAGRRMRKMSIRYARFHPLAEEVKKQFIEVRSLREWQAVLDRWYAQDASGVWPASSSIDLVNA